MKILKLLSSSLLALSVISCASSSQPSAMTTGSGFLVNYASLTPVATNDDNMKLYRYVNPEFKRSDYHAVMIAPVVIYQSDAEKNNTAYKDVKATLDASLNEMISKQFAIAQSSANGVAKVEVAITGAEVSNDGFHARNLIPVSAVIKLATMSAGVDNKQAVLMIEAKITDSKTGKLIGQSVTTINSEQFRNSDNMTAQMQNNAKIWVNQAVKNAVGYN